MRQKHLADEIKKWLTHFVTQVKISNANNEYDVNIHSENVIIPILNLLFDVNLQNANYSERKNSESIDLIDESKRIAFQVTSTIKLEKIKDTIEKFIESKYKNKIDKLFVYILTEKQQSYSQQAIDKVSKNQVIFSSKENIIDASDVYRLVNSKNNLSVMESIERILKSQFSEVFIKDSFTLSEFQNFKRQYAISSLNNFSRINFFGLSLSRKPREVELYQLFVNPKFRVARGINNFALTAEDYNFYKSVNSSKGFLRFFDTASQPAEKKSFAFINTLYRDSRKYSFDEFLNITFFEENLKNFSSFIDLEFKQLYSGAKNIVILGNPGAGKSLMVKYTICKILEKDLNVFENKEIFEYTPFRIELHKYNKAKKLKPVSLISYLSDILEEEYQVSISDEILKAVISKFPTLFFFDGLDEIFDIQERLGVRNDIEAFVKMFQLSRAVVTCRFESYEEVRLSEKNFERYEVLGFDDKQVKEYVNKWYSLEEPNERQREKELKDCLNQLQVISEELKYNPLLLSLILILYRNQLEIPASKLEIYEGCTNTIVETRDTKEKKLNFSLKINNKIAVFASLAYWQFKNESQGKFSINFDTVKSFITKYLLEKGEFNEENVAENATLQFLEFAKIRSIYFENKFTHKTFLEYFTAYFIYSGYYGKYSKQNLLKKIVSDYIGLSSWSVVLELLICKIDSTQLDFEVIDEIVDEQIKANGLDALIFFLQTVRYLRNISPSKTSFIIRQSIIYCFKDGQKTKEGKPNYKEILFTSLSSLHSSDRFAELIKEEFRLYIRESKISDFYLTAFAYEFALVTTSSSLVQVIKEERKESDGEYIFILKHFPSFVQKENFLTALELFVERFTAKKTGEVYTSPFQQKIFFDSERFNWNVTFLAFTGLNNIEQAYRDLLKRGVTKDVLIDSAKRKSAKLAYNDFQMSAIPLTSTDSFVKKLFKTLKNGYYPSTLEVKHENAIFYDKFFINKRKQKR